MLYRWSLQYLFVVSLFLSLKTDPVEVSTFRSAGMGPEWETSVEPELDSVSPALNAYMCTAKKSLNSEAKLGVAQRGAQCVISGSIWPVFKGSAKIHQVPLVDMCCLSCFWLLESLEMCDSGISVGFRRIISMCRTRHSTCSWTWQFFLGIFEMLDVFCKALNKHCHLGCEFCMCKHLSCFLHKCFCFSSGPHCCKFCHPCSPWRVQRSLQW